MSNPPSHTQLADHLHSLALHLLRRVRAVDAASELTAPQLSALSVLVFGGPCSPSQLAQAEQVSLPTISRMLKDLERAGLLTRQPHPEDKRSQLLTPTAAAQEILAAGRARRTAEVMALLAELNAAELVQVAQAVATLQPHILPVNHPHHPDNPAHIE